MVERYGTAPEEAKVQFQGTMEDRYDIYVAACEALGIEPLSFDEWMNS